MASAPQIIAHRLVQWTSGGADERRAIDAEARALFFKSNVCSTVVNTRACTVRGGDGSVDDRNCTYLRYWFEQCLPTAIRLQCDLLVGDLDELDSNAVLYKQHIFNSTAVGIDDTPAWLARIHNHRLVHQSLFMYAALSERGHDALAQDGGGAELSRDQHTTASSERNLRVMCSVPFIVEPKR